VASVLAIVPGMTLVSDGLAAKQTIQNLDARVVAINIPGASAIIQIGKFVTGGTLDPSPVGAPCANPNPIPKNFSDFIQPGTVHDPNRILVGSQSNFGAPLDVVGLEGAFLSIDPTGLDILNVPSNFASNVSSIAPQPSRLKGAVQMFASNNSHWLNSVNNNIATNGILPNTAQYTGVSNRTIMVSVGFGQRTVWRHWRWLVLDPRPDRAAARRPSEQENWRCLCRQPNKSRRSDHAVATADHSGCTLSTGAVGTALLGRSPDETCRAVFVVVTADGAIVQEHTQKGLDGLAPTDTVKSIVGRSWGPPSADIDPRFGVIMNPYIPEGAPAGSVRQLFVSEPFDDTIAVVNLLGTPPDQVFSLASVTRISSAALNLPVDLTPVKRDKDNVNWASNTTLDEDSDFYVANRGDNTIVRITQAGMVVAIGRVVVPPGPLNNASLNGIATSTDGKKIYVTFTRPGHSAYQGGVLEVPALCAADHPSPCP
jgi:hypothetical protein